MHDATLRTLLARLLTTARGRLATDAARLDALSPLKVLGRGYALAFGPGGRLVRAATDVAPGDRLDLRVGSGRLTADVVAVQPPEGSPPDIPVTPGPDRVR